MTQIRPPVTYVRDDWQNLSDTVWVKSLSTGDYLMAHFPVDNSSECETRAIIIDTTSGQRHALVLDDPLTIEPSIMCPACGLEGNITSGEWIPYG